MKMTHLHYTHEMLSVYISINVYLKQNQKQWKIKNKTALRWKYQSWLNIAK